MGRYQIRMNNVDRFDHAFFDTQCAGQDCPIEEGDPIYRIDGEYYCRDCGPRYGDPGKVSLNE